jgi:hypothetical protein
VNESLGCGDALVVAERTRSRIIVEETREAELLDSDPQLVRLDEPNERAEIGAISRTNKKLTLITLGVLVALVALALAAYTWMTGKDRREQRPRHHTINGGAAVQADSGQRDDI